MTVVLVNPFVVAPVAEDDFVAAWRETAAVFSAEPGYVDTRLHRSIDPDARFRFVNVAHWTSEGHWRDAMKRFPPTEKGRHGVEANPALYMPVPGGSIAARNAAHDLEATIRMLEETLARAYRNNDASALDRLLMDDYVVTDGPGTTSDKAKVLGDHRDARLKVDAFAFDEIAVLPVGADATVVTGRYRWTAAYDGHPIAGAFRYLRVYVLDGDRGWRVRAGQVTPILEERS